MRDFATIAATNAAIVDIGNRLAFERIRVWFHRQRRATTQSNTGMIAGTGVFIDAKPFFGHALAAGHVLPELRLLPALAIQHALGLPDDCRRLS